MRSYSLLLTSLVLFNTLFAQRTVFEGRVIDKNTTKPLSGASIANTQTGTGTVSASDGKFRIMAEKNDVLTISMVGYTPQTIAVNTIVDGNIFLESASTSLAEVVLVGSRRNGRVKMETPVPVDVVNIGQITATTARTDITSILNYAAPSFNYNKQTGSDGADHIDLATLRGLGPDQTLVLINGKRRHQTAFVGVFGTRGRGNSGTDLSALPVNAIDRVEILRDGASAQYGSDAIAGVINLVLKKNTGTFTGSLNYSGYYDKKYNPYFKKEIDQYIYEGAMDGKALQFNGNYGWDLGQKGGFLHLSMNLQTQGKTYRQALDDDPNSDEFMYTNIYRRAHGDGSVNAAGAFLNMELPVGSGNTVFYAFGGFNSKKSDAYAFTRNWSARPDRFPTTSSGALIYVPGIMQVSGDNDTFYNPHIQTKISDLSIAAGLKGKNKSGWDWDLSNSLGRNNFHFFGDKTFNASLGKDKTRFDDGGFHFLQNTVNYNLSKEMSKDFNLALGAEWRSEQYGLYAGEEASYKNYDPTGEKATGSQGFPGYQPGDEVTDRRNVLGAYADAEWDASKNMLLGAALRYEYYSDFGSTFNMKLASRIKAGEHFNLRGSVSTGFRAPSLQQINFSSTFTTVQAGILAEVKIAPNYSPITKAAGIPALKQEKSMNASVGFAWKPGSNWNLTVDGYLVKIKDRVVLSGQFSVDDNTLDPSLIQAMQSLDVSLAQFFANAVNTTNRGVDIVLEYNKQLGEGKKLKGLFTANFQQMDIDKINVPVKLDDSEDHRKTFLSDREQKFILASAPNSKFAFNFEYGMNKLTLGTRLTYFGKVVLLGYGEDGLGIDPQVPSDADGNSYVPDQFNFSGKVVTDLYINYSLKKGIQLSVGADNLLNVHPDLGINPLARGWAFNNETGGPWDAVQMGGNGMRLFARIGFSF